MNPWITYRTRFLVKAKQLTTNLAFVDDLGRQHSGLKGDYLVESSDGVLSIAPRRIFEDIYVVMSEPREPSSCPTSSPDKTAAANSLPHYNSEIPLSHILGRKSPQPFREIRTPASGLRSM